LGGRALRVPLAALKQLAEKATTNSDSKDE
jgi:hypothetical protein